MSTLEHASNICTLLTESSRETAITSPVNLIRDAHRSVTGTDLSIRDAIHRLHTYGSAMGVGDNQPMSLWKPRVISLLCAATYTAEAIILVLDHCDRYGTAQCCPYLHADDIDDVEALLPDQPDEDWSRAEFAGAWVTN